MEKPWIDSGGLTSEKRTELRDRLATIDSVLQEIGFCLNDMGEIVAVRNSNFLDRMENALKLSSHRLRIAEYKHEIASIRYKLFGTWARYYLDVEKLDKALASAVDKEGENIFKMLFNPEPGSFSCQFNPETFQSIPLNYSNRKIESLLEVNGRLTDDPEANRWGHKERYIIAMLKVHPWRDSVVPEPLPESEASCAFCWCGTGIPFREFLERIQLLDLKSIFERQRASRERFKKAANGNSE